MTEFLNGVLSALIRLVLIASGVVMAGLVLVVGVGFGAFVLVWSLLAGRKPRFRFQHVDPRAAMAGTRARAQAPRQRPHASEVIDIDAREVKD